jgi:hypothetical protein
MADPTNSRDMAGKGGMDLLQLEELVKDSMNQPEWRERADTVAAFIDGKQISPLERAEKEETGQPVSITNLIQRTLNGALGQEAKARVDWKATADNDAFVEVAEVINDRLHEAQRECYADMAISDAYKGQIGPGLGWVEVSRNPDPLEYPYRVEEVHRNEIWWDWRSKRRDLTDARWICRQRWVDKDEGEMWFPQHKDVFHLACHNGPITDALSLQLTQADSFERLMTTRSSFNVLEEEWLDTTRQRIKFYEVWYRVPKVLVSLLLPAGRRTPFQPSNPLHHEMVNRGIAQLIKGPSFEIRQSMFAGPYRLSDKATTLRRYPYIPFWCYRDDADRTPYGLGDGMISPQQEYNERRSKLLWLLKAKQVFVDADALDDKYNSLAELAAEAMRPDAMFVLNPGRLNRPNGLKIEMNGQLQKEQVDVMQDAKQLIQDVPGIYSTMLGDAPTGVTSGLAINSLVEQSMVSLGEVNDNYRYARRMVGEALQSLIGEDLQARDLQMRIGEGKKARVVVLNTMDDMGLPKNQVKDAPVKVGLHDVPSTPAYRMQQQQSISQALQAVGANPAASVLLTAALIDSSDIPNHAEYASWLRKQAGIPEPGTADDDQAQEQEMQAQQVQAAAMQLQAEAAAAKIARDKAAAEQAQSAAQLNLARAEQVQVDTMLAPAQQQAANENQLIDDALAEAAA